MPASALHQIDVFNRDRAAVAVINHQDGEADRRLGGRDREHEERKNLADDVAETRGEGHEIDVDRKQDQLDRHQDDDDILAVEEDAENPEREQERRNNQIMAEADGHCTVSCSPWPERTFRISIAVSLVRAICSMTFCRLTFGLCRSVSTMAPIIDTKSTMPAASK